VRKLVASISDDLDDELRKYIKERYGGRRGALSIVVEEAIKEFLEKR
jgi:hypothetical protein